jgi:glucokinase
MMSNFAVGIDIGGTKIAAGVIDSSARVMARSISKAHAGQPPNEVIAATVEAFHTVLAQAGLQPGDVAGLGVGFGGHVNGAAGLILTSSNLPAWDNHPLRDHLQARLGVPIILENDSNCCAWAEYRFGAGQGSRYFCYVTFSTGYGLGIVIDGKLYVGATGTAGELAHTVVQPDGPLCTCGKRGCVMSYASGLGISRLVRERLDRGEPTLLRELCGPAPARVAGEVVVEAADRGDRVAQEILAIAGRYFGLGLSSVVQMFNPDRIVIGGGLAHVEHWLMQPCFAALRENIHPVLLDSAEIVYSQLWEDAGMIGAAALVWERVIPDKEINPISNL